MMLRIITKMADKYEKALEKVETEAVLKSSGQILVSFARNDDTFIVTFHYPGENRASNWILKKELRKKLKKIDKDFTLEEI
jgi:hypothetical protein